MSVPNINVFIFKINALLLNWLWIYVIPSPHLSLSFDLRFNKWDNSGFFIWFPKLMNWIDSWLIFIFCLFIVKIFKKSIMILISFHLVLWVLLCPHPINSVVFYFVMFSLSIFFKRLPVKLLFARIWEINLIFRWKSVRAHQWLSLDGISVQLFTYFSSDCGFHFYSTLWYGVKTQFTFSF